VTNELTPLVQALTAAARGVGDGEPQTRLAVMVTVVATGVTVRFEGETAASGRVYVATAGGLSVGDRVVMLRVGRTYVCVGVLGASTPLVQATMLGAWSHYDARTVRYWRDSDGMVHMVGLAKNGAGNICQLPTGFRPIPVGVSGNNHHFPVAANNAFGSVGVTDDGYVALLAGSNIWVDLSSIHFPAGA
jgi:hypothetical protein